jgi:hypothetical protein
VLREHHHELWIGDAAEIRAAMVRKQKTDTRDALHILDLMLTDRFRTCGFLDSLQIALPSIALTILLPRLGQCDQKGSKMIWAQLLAYVTGTVDQELLLRNEYLAAENRILKAQIKGRLLLSPGGMSRSQ